MSSSSSRSTKCLGGRTELFVLSLCNIAGIIFNILISLLPLARAFADSIQTVSKDIVIEVGKDAADSLDLDEKKNESMMDAMDSMNLMPDDVVMMSPGMTFVARLSAEAVWLAVNVVFIVGVVKGIRWLALVWLLFSSLHLTLAMLLTMPSVGAMPPWLAVAACVVFGLEGVTWFRTLHFHMKKEYWARNGENGAELAADDQYLFGGK